MPSADRAAERPQPGHRETPDHADVRERQDTPLAIAVRGARGHNDLDVQVPLGQMVAVAAPGWSATRSPSPMSPAVAARRRTSATH
jgi:hypothetical protein